MGDALVTTSVEDGVGTISLNRPERHNALNDEMSAQLGDAWRWAAAESDVRVILLRGEGPSFSSGRDTAELGRRAPGVSDYAFVRASQTRNLHTLDSPKPVVAALRGYVLGGALEMALAADMRICADDARMGFPEVRYGIMTDTGGAPLTTALAGPSRAKLLLMTGELIDAAQALDWGLVERVVPPAELDGTARELAARIAAGPPLAIAMIKQVVNEVWHGSLHAGIRAELLAQSTLFATADRTEAASARVEGRPPRYRGL